MLRPLREEKSASCLVVCCLPTLPLSFLSTLLPSSHISGGLHSLATAALHTECSIECSIECSLGLLPSFHTDPSSSASTGSPAGSLAATDSYRVLMLTITVADAICCG